ncbi:MAG: hypothetical protein KDI13_05785 [Alphaproteobacteria bacterium]|nr:hypothetical protein [Alphaproteobacteria bacterium]
MASFDLIEMATKGYDFTWKHRTYIARAAIPLIFLKIICELSIGVLGLEKNILRQELVMMPAYALEALFFCNLVRYALYREPIIMPGLVPVLPTVLEPPPVPYQGRLSRRLCLKAGIAFYLLFKILLIVLSWGNIALSEGHSPGDMPNYEITPLVSFAMLMLIWALLWVFLWLIRMSWAFVAATLGYSVKIYFKHVFKVRVALSVVGLMLLCLVPFDVVFEFTRESMVNFFEGHRAIQIIMSSVISTLGETLLTAISTIAMTYAIHTLLTKQEKEKR